MLLSLHYYLYFQIASKLSSVSCGLALVLMSCFQIQEMGRGEQGHWSQPFAVS